MVWGNWALGFAGPGGGLVSNIHGGGLPAFFDTTETDETRERERERAEPVSHRLLRSSRLVSPPQSRGRNGSDCRLVENKHKRFLGLPAPSPPSYLSLHSPSPLRPPLPISVVYYIYASACSWFARFIAWPAAGLVGFLICIFAVLRRTLAGDGERARQVSGGGHWQRQLGQRRLSPHRLQHRQVALLL